ncbi:PREDICTED: activating transcription factor 7-interacting protein 1-like, partial [Nanorana parkeri]|uniref:activating transcription factor 7-interacting protein 1-like n=1 Tax=Nanorana parkeri TaxID=125878 RepID=UPI000854604D
MAPALGRKENGAQRPLPFTSGRFKMDTAEEPQKKIFKARKTMKTSDRQQLEAIHKAKEDLLKPTEQKLVNGNHENGDSDMNSIHNETDSLEDKSDLNGIVDIKCDSRHVVKVNLSDLKEGLRNVDQDSDLKLPAELNLPKSIACEDTSRNVTGGEDIQTSVDISDPKLDENISALEANDQMVSEGLSMLESLSGDIELSEAQSNVPMEDGLIVAKDLNDLKDVNPVVNSVEKECADAGTFENLLSDKVETATELHNLESLHADCDNVDNQENSDKNYHNEKDEKEFQGNEIQNAEENNGKEEIVEAIHLQENLTDMDVAESECSSEAKNECQTLDIPSPQQDVEEAISSSMEVDHSLKSIEQSSPLAEEASLDKTVSELEQGSTLECLDTMETDEIIPILEKLAPVHDDLQCFSKSVLHSENSVANQEKVEDSTDSPTKNDVSESLPSEAFLVLSDEEEPCEITPAQEITSNDDQDSSKHITTEAAVVEDQQKPQENACNAKGEKGKFALLNL